MASVLLVGFLLGVTHALEMDHLAAVASLATRASSARRALSLGALWGLNHTLTLLCVSGVVLGFGLGAPERFSHWLELGVAVMLVLLGGDVLRRAVVHRVHVHRHRHADGREHVHVHSHVMGADHDDHPHPEPVTWRALFVGLMHGMAGSAALIVLVLASARDLYTSLLYVALFGVGSILGMAGRSSAPDAASRTSLYHVLGHDAQRIHETVHVEVTRVGPQTGETHLRSKPRSHSVTSSRNRSRGLPPHR